MSSALVHPRRRSLKDAPPTLDTFSSSSSLDAPSCSRPSTHNMSLRKGSTFHSPTTPPSEDFDPILHVRSLPKRSSTCSRTLEDVIAAGEKRMAEFIGTLERNLSGLTTNDIDDDDSQATLRQEDLPVPRGILEANIVDSDMTDADALDQHKDSKDSHRVQPEHTHNRHLSDSGLGSSISGTTLSYLDGEDKMAHTSPYRLRNHPSTRPRSTHTSTSAITSSANNNTNKESLPQYARKEIERHIIVPILREKRLRIFHSLVKGIPERIEQKEITCLRDLEKTLIFLAPRFAATKTAYLNFCETSIQCIHTTVEYLNERDQRRPADRPYTNGYFLDLVEQIRQYAAMMAAARAREAAGEEGGELDYSGDEEVTIEGGLGQNGRPAELVRKKKGKQISLQTGEVYESQTSPSTGLKRSFSEDSSDDSVLRSMARRKKNAPAEPAQTCDACGKEFKRPCDLTKHAKTHSRPWKCPDGSCKYHELGWPTEKEMQRHHNDKHSKAPPLYRCLFKDCSYSSKRESNCKQHMEKTHNWTYVRSKNNGRNGKKPAQSNTPQTPITNMTPQSTPMEMPTPVSATLPSPYEQYHEYNAAYSVTDSTSPSEDYPYHDVDNHSGLLDDSADVNIDPYAGFPSAIDFNEFERNLAAHPDAYVAVSRPGNDANVLNSEAGPSNYIDNSNFGAFEEWPPQMDNDFTAFNVQMITPAASTEIRPLHDFSRHHSLSAQGNQVASLSPAGQGNLMLYSPQTSNDITADEGFEEFAGESGKPIGDFSLFDNSHGSSSLSIVNNNTMFPPLATNISGNYVNHGWGQRDAQAHYAPSHLHMDEDFMEY